MHKNLLRIAGISVILIMIVCMNTLAQDQSPVRIVFDKNSQRIDLMTGKQLPNYTQAQRGSIQFYLGRLDAPVDGFWYFFDGRRFKDVNNLIYMRKMPSLGCWLITPGLYTGPTQSASGSIPSDHNRENVEIQQNAVSFIPLDSNGRPQPKIYVLLDDLELIQWAPYNHWMVNDTQEQIRAKAGVVY